MTRTAKKNDSAVSPVVGVMMMLVVTIIIAAIVSAFASGTVSTTKKVSQLAIQGKFSISDGMQIIHAGGDAVPLADVNFIIRDNSAFGSNVEQKTTQILNATNIQNNQGISITDTSLTTNRTSFNSGDTLYVNATDSSCDVLQPVIAPEGISGTSFTGSSSDLTNWALCIRNPNNVGKSFTLIIADKKGNTLASTDVTIAG